MCIFTVTDPDILKSLTNLHYSVGSMKSVNINLQFAVFNKLCFLNFVRTTFYRYTNIQT
ncbi:hypothetical protein RND71_026436 [Anisodus tanguticus]|uniref:Uncharacterized protein n=1 Tax=Anisodus tanguticus TaxID=243964 RepID=A0AAE1RNX1_9SOLA|nr:hypothetical protein RND71_026436 [Anisodus tanguticus]